MFSMYFKSIVGGNACNDIVFTRFWNCYKKLCDFCHMSDRSLETLYFIVVHLKQLHVAGLFFIMNFTFFLVFRLGLESNSGKFPNFQGMWTRLWPEFGLEVWPKTLWKNMKNLSDANFDIFPLHAIILSVLE